MNTLLDACVCVGCDANIRIHTNNTNIERGIEKNSTPTVLLKSKEYIMPYPIGHAAIGVATYVIATKATGITGDNWWRLLIFLFILSNFSDVDYFFNFILKANIHRGPTHTFYFAFLMGVLVYTLGKYSNNVPNIGFIPCFLVLLSHPIADIIQSALAYHYKLTFTRFFKALFCPTINWSKDIDGFWEIASQILRYSFRDYKIILGSAVVIAMIFLLRKLG